jgi:hypothetical protein
LGDAEKEERRGIGDPISNSYSFSFNIRNTG